VERAFAEAGAVTHVFHLAAVTFVPAAGRDPAGTFRANLQGTVHVAEAMRRAHPDARLVFIASGEVYGAPVSLPITEQHPLNPVNPYAISKTAADQYCRWLHAAEGVDTIRMRPFNHTGPGQNDAFALPAFAHQIAQIEQGAIPPILRVGNLEARRDFSHVEDVVEAYELAATAGEAGQAYNVCSGRAVSIRHALDLLLGMAKTPIAVEQDPDRMRAVEIAESFGSYDKLHQATGWQPKRTFESLLAELLAYWRTAA